MENIGEKTYFISRKGVIQCYKVLFKLNPNNSLSVILVEHGVHNVPEVSDTNTFAEKGKSETSTDYHEISCLGGVGNRVGNLFGRG